MGTTSIVSGYITAWDERYMGYNMQAINAFPFDEYEPFTNIFWGGSPARYFFPLIGFTGSYRGIEANWSEWLWKFSQLLTCLEAIEARITLDCILGSNTWDLCPKANCYPMRQVSTFVGEQWVITQAPVNDFSIDPEWLRYCEQNKTFDPLTNDLIPYKWDKFVERLPRTPKP